MPSIRTPRHPRSLCAVALFLGALSLNAGAQGPPASAPEDRLLQLDSIGSPGLDLVIPSQAAGAAVAMRIFWMGRVPSGFEGVYEAPAQPPRRARFDMTGATVREALDTLVRSDPRYLWQSMNGVIVVRPVLASADPHNLRNQPVRDINWRDVTAEQAFVNVRKLINESSNVPSTFAGSDHDARLLSIRVQSGSVLDVLNEIVRAHGELMWSVEYVGPARRGVVQTGPRVSFIWVDGHGIGGVPVRRQAAGGALDVGSAFSRTNPGIRLRARSALRRDPAEHRSLSRSSQSEKMSCDQPEALER